MVIRMSDQEIFDTLRRISTYTCNSINQCKTLFVESSSINYSKIQSLKKFSSSTNRVVTAFDKFKTGIVDGLQAENNQSNVDSAFKEELCAHLDSLKGQEKELEHNLHVAENKLDEVNREITALKKNMKSLDILKKEAKFLKLITATTFEYRDEDVSGYTLGDGKVKSFQLDKKQMSQEAITEELWDHMKMTCDEDYKRIIARLGKATPS